MYTLCYQDNRIAQVNELTSEILQSWRTSQIMDILSIRDSKIVRLMDISTDLDIETWSSISETPSY